MTPRQPVVLESNPDVLELSIATAAKALAIALPRIEPLKQEKLFVAISLALEQAQFGLHFLENVKSLMPEAKPEAFEALKKASRIGLVHPDRPIKDGKLLASEGRESPVICGYVYRRYSWGLGECEELMCKLEKDHEGSHVA